MRVPDGWAIFPCCLDAVRKDASRRPRDGETVWCADCGLDWIFRDLKWERTDAAQ